MGILDKIENFYNKYSNKQLAFLLMFFVIMYSSFLLFVPGIPRGHDLTFHLARISGIKDGLLTGEFPVKIYPNYVDGYGYANGLFYPDLFLYFPAVLNLIGLNVLVAYKVFLASCTLCTAFSIYLCVKEISKSYFAATISMILYTLASYRMLDLYERAAIGEVLAFIFVPLIVLGIYKIIYDDYKQWYFLSAGFCGLFLSHLISTLIMTGITALMVIMCFKRLFKEPKRIFYLIIATIITFLLVAFFLLPMMEQLHNYKFNLSKPSFIIWKTTVPILKLFFEIPNMVLRLGAPSGIGMVFLVILIIRFKIKGKKEGYFNFSDLCIYMGVLSLLASTKFFPWKSLVNLVDQLNTIQFAWRFYLFATAFLSISGGIILYKYCNNIKLKIKGFIAVLILSVFACSMNMYASYGAYGYYVWKGLYELDLTTHSIGLGEYLPYGTDAEKIQERGDIITSNNTKLHIKYANNGTNMDIQFNDNKIGGTYIELPLIYYSGYKAFYGNGNEQDNLIVKKGKNNLIRINLKGYEKGSIHVSYSGTKLQKIANIISSVTLILLLIVTILKRLVRKRHLVEASIEKTA
jgi:hypothetical protein